MSKIFIENNNFVYEYPSIKLPKLPKSPNIEYTNIYNIDLNKFNISNNLTNATATTNGINNAMVWAKANGYNGVKIPKGEYLIDTEVTNPILVEDKNNVKPYKWYHNRCGIFLQSNFILDITDCLLKALPCINAYSNILTISTCSNVKIIGGTIMGDKLTHKYGHMVNFNGGELEEGGIDDTTGELIPDIENGYIRTKNYISEFHFADGSVGQLPNTFHVVPILKTKYNTTDGGRCYIYCYDENNKYLGKLGGSYCKVISLIPNTKSLKIKFWKESNNLNGIYALSQEQVYKTFEFNMGITLANCSLIEISGTTINNCVGDCIFTASTPIPSEVNDLTIIDCTLENSRRQGISLVANGHRYLVKDSNIGNIQGIDPQSGIDIEHYDYVEDVTIDNVTFYGNKKLDFINYNGSIVQVKNCNITNSLAVSTGNTMDITNNKFVYKGPLTNYNRPNCTLRTENNRIHDNYFENYIVICDGENSHIYNNECSNSNLRLFKNDKNIYSNSELIFENQTLTYLNNSIFNNCKTTIKDDSNDLIIENCVFNNCSFMYRLHPILKNCQINSTDISFFQGWMGDTRSCTLLNCDININKPILSSGIYVILVFENCNIISTREYFYNNGSMTFKNCTISLKDDDNIENLIWNNCYNSYFYNCIMTAEKLTKVRVTNKLESNTIAPSTNIIII